MSVLNLPKGRRLTRQRQIMLDDLRKRRCHLTAAEVYQSVKKKLPQISLGTVYRNLKFLQKEGYVAGILCNPCEAEQFEGFTDHCQHFICRICKKVFDCQKSLPGNFKPKELNYLKAEGHRIEGYHLYLTGICKSCLKKTKK
jgi:Fe2+ or Zn2+ uptake regulation protein